ncbi:MAG TPA: glycosyltransferase family 87 protein [Bryobacteraceae bacterium]|nr:glycosyltransferase family 87 protein [Bryobacteraceae bacterium]
METRSRPVSPTRQTVYLKWFLCLFTCALLFAIFGVRANPIDNEVFNLYAGVRVGPHKLYDPQAFRAIAAALGPVMTARLYYCRMPYFVVLTAPLGWFPYPVAVAFWRSVQTLAIAAAILLWRRSRRTMAMVALASLPAVWVVSTGQDVALVFLAVAGSVALLRRDKPVLAGAVFSLCLGKPHLVVFVPLALLALKNYRFLLGAAAGGASQILFSFAMAGPDWPRQWLANLSDAQMHPNVQAMPGLRAIAQTGPGIVLAALIAGSLAVAVWKLAGRRPIEEAMAYALAAGVLGNLHSYGVDCILLIPAVTVALTSPRISERGVGIFLATPVPYISMIFGFPALLQAGILALVHLPFAPQAATLGEQPLASLEGPGS